MHWPLHMPCGAIAWCMVSLVMHTCTNLLRPASTCSFIAGEPAVTATHAQTLASSPAGSSHHGQSWPAVLHRLKSPLAPGCTATARSTVVQQAQSDTANVTGCCRTHHQVSAIHGRHSGLSFCIGGGLHMIMACKTWHQATLQSSYDSRANAGARVDD